MCAYKEYLRPMMTLYISEKLEREEKNQSNNQSLKLGFHYFTTLIMIVYQ